MKGALFFLRVFLLSLLPWMMACRQDDQSRENKYRENSRGLHYRVIKDRQGSTPARGDVVILGILMKTDDLEILNTFYNREDYYIKTGEPLFKADIAGILNRFSNGDSIHMFELAKDLYSGQPPHPIEPDDTVSIILKIKSFYSEKLLINNYVDSADYIKNQTTKNGAFIGYKKKGTGPEIHFGDSVVVDFEGRLFNGTIFNTTQNKKRPFGFVIGKKRVVQGWEEGILKLKKGDHVELIVPSRLGYGADGAPPAIPPYSPLVYEIEVKKVIKSF